MKYEVGDIVVSWTGLGDGFSYFEEERQVLAQACAKFVGHNVCFSTRDTIHIIGYARWDLITLMHAYDRLSPGIDDRYIKLSVHRTNDRQYNGGRGIRIVYGGEEQGALRER